MEETMMNTINESNQWMSILIPPIVTIIGFIINILITKSTLKSQIKTNKNNVHLDKLQDVPARLVDFYKQMLNNKNDPQKNKVLFKEFDNLLTEIFAYGSEEAIRILSYLQQETYKANKNNQLNVQILYTYALLACQIKYDLTEIKVSPDSFYKISINDYNEQKEGFKKINNQIVEKLNLAGFLKIE